MKRPVKVLMIEDEQDFVDSCEEYFREDVQGYAFFKAYSGMAGMRLVESERPDVLVLDMNLGAGPGGVDVLKKSKQMHPGLKVIVLTGYLDPALEEQARGLGIDAYLEKPISSHASLQQAIDRVLAS